MIYLDSSALVKTVRDEPHSAALRGWLAARGDALMSSALVRVESRRALIRVRSGALPALNLALAQTLQVAVSDAILDAATAISEPNLRSLDAIHLATAASLRSSLTDFVAYDKRLCAAALAHGLPVRSPS